MLREFYDVDENGNKKTQIEKALEKIDGVNNVCVDLLRNSIEVIYNEPASEQEIKESIKNNGYFVE